MGQDVVYSVQPYSQVFIESSGFSDDELPGRARLPSAPCLGEDVAFHPLLALLRHRSEKNDVSENTRYLLNRRHLGNSKEGSKCTLGHDHEHARGVGTAVGSCGNLWRLDTSAQRASICNPIQPG